MLGVNCVKTLVQFLLSRASSSGLVTLKTKWGFYRFHTLNYAMRNIDCDLNKVRIKYLQCIKINELFLHIRKDGKKQIIL